MRDLERVALDAATRAGALLRARFGGRHEVTHKGEVDLVTATDREAERLIVDAIRAAFPAHGIVAEEEDTLLVAVVHDPLRGETFSAVRGQGARLNGAPIAVSPTLDLGAALLGTGFPYDRRRRPGFYLAFVEEALTRAQCVRGGGSAALDLCYVASGRLDGFWAWKLQPWDTAAGRLIVEEAGGRVSDFAGGPHRLAGAETAASNGHLHPALLALLGAAGDRFTPAERVSGSG